jgi:hypothetical protein
MSGHCRTRQQSLLFGMKLAIKFNIGYFVDNYAKFKERVMHARLLRTFIYGLAVAAVAVLCSPLMAKDPPGGGKGDGGGRSGGAGISEGANIGGNVGGNVGGAVVNPNVGKMSKGQGAWSQGNQGVQKWSNQFNPNAMRQMDRNRGAVAGKSFTAKDFSTGKDFNRWDRRYSYFYGPGWDYWPGFGWGIGIPFGRYGYLGFGDYYGYYGYPYGWYGYPYDYYAYGYYPYGYYGGTDYGYGGSYAYTAPEEEPAETVQQTENKLPPIPTEKDLARLTDEQLDSFIAWVANGFAQELGQFSTGDTWVKYFDLNGLKTMSPSPPTKEGVAQGPSGMHNKGMLADVLKRMDLVSRNDEYQSVASLWGFKALNAALNEATKPSDERRPGVVRGQAEMLSQALKRLPTGESWQKFLDLGTLEKISSSEDLKSNEISDIAKRFDSVARNSEYRSIAQLPGFGGIHSTLHKIGEGREVESTAKRPVPAAPETTEK